MSKKNQSAKVETEILTSIGAPETMSFEEMKKAVTEYKKLQKLIKSMPKEDRAKLMPKRERIISDNIKDMIDDIKVVLSQHVEEIQIEFQRTISTEKPKGQRWLTWKLEDYTFCLAINKPKKTD